MLPSQSRMYSLDEGVNTSGREDENEKQTLYYQTLTNKHNLVNTTSYIFKIP